MTIGDEIPMASAISRKEDLARNHAKGDPATRRTSISWGRSRLHPRSLRHAWRAYLFVHMGADVGRRQCRSVLDSHDELVSNSQR